MTRIEQPEFPRAALRAGWLGAVAVLIVGCAPSDPAGMPVDGGQPPSADAALVESGVDAGPAAPDAAPAEGLVEVSHRRELRGTWVATVSRINWPSSSDPAAQRAELVSILDAARAAGLNAIFFQVRPEADALYASELEPWSRYLTGTQGVDPGYDPLQFAIEQCHQRGLELHAWLNPYRARAGDVGASAANHVINQMPQAVVAYGTLRWLDPGHPDAFDHTVAVIRDLLTRYDIDGLHFDDYFYPYPEDGLSFDDAATYAQYGGGLSLGDWRRDNVNRLIEAVGDAVNELRPDVRWGVAPFGIYRPGMPEGVVGLDQYATIYADPLRWLSEGWVEYLAPQLYWPTTSSGQPYQTLLEWWGDRATEAGRTLFVGNSASSGYGLDEYRAEMEVARAAEERSVRGSIWWSVAPILSSSNGLADMLADEYYAAPAASPPLTTAVGAPPSPPVIEVEDGLAQVATTAEGMRYWAVYRAEAGGWQLDRLIPADQDEFALWDGQWAVSVIDRSGRESLGVELEGEGDAPSPEPPTGQSCVHSYGGVYADRGCSPGYQCCDGVWQARGACGECVCEEATGTVGCGT